MSKRDLKPVQLKTELEKCLHCATKPCMKACPVHCSPCDFIFAAKSGDWQKAARLIQQQNPLAQSCGLICPAKFCMKACVRANMDMPIKIPAVQAAIMQKAGTDKIVFEDNSLCLDKRVAVIGSGPAGWGAASILLEQGYGVTIFEMKNKIGGALNLIPEYRLPQEVIEADWQRLSQNSKLELKLNTYVQDYASLLEQGFAGVIVAVGEQQSRSLGIEGENFCISYVDYLCNPQKYQVCGNVAVVGGGEVALDCALTAKQLGGNVEMFVRRRLSDMRMEKDGYADLVENEINVTTMTRVSKIERQNNGLLNVFTVKTQFNSENRLEDICDSEISRPNFSLVILALGSRCGETFSDNDFILYAGDCVNGGTTAVEAVASGKKAAQELLNKIS